jgi:hypothetical protein
VRQRHIRLLDELQDLTLFLQQGQTPRIGAQRLGGGRRNRVHTLPVQQRSACRVLIQQIADDRGAGARHAQHDQRPLDRGLDHLGV